MIPLQKKLKKSNQREFLRIKELKLRAGLVGGFATILILSSADFCAHESK
jgi:hypothetical protein